MMTRWRIFKINYEDDGEGTSKKNDDSNDDEDDTDDDGKIMLMRQ